MQYLDHAQDEEGNLLILMKRIKGKLLNYHLKMYESEFKAIKEKESAKFQDLRT